MKVLIFGKKGYLSNSLLFDQKKKFRITLLSKKVLREKIKLKEKFDLIIHSLGANKFDSEKNKKETLKNKKKLTYSLINFAKEHNIRKIIYISSTNIYKKNYNYNKNSYINGHLQIEKSLKKISSAKLKILVLRISHLFGIRDIVKSKGKFISVPNKFIQSALNRRKYLIKDKNAKINILPMSYLIFKIENLINFKKNYKIVDISFINLKLTFLLQLISKRIIHKFKFKPKIHFNDGKQLDLNKIKEYSIKNGAKLKILNKEIDETIDFLKKNYKH